MIHVPFYIFHELFINHYLLHYNFILHLQIDQLLEDILKEEQKRCCALNLQCDKINHASNLTINDSTENSRYIGATPHNLMLVCLKMTDCIPLKNQKIDWNNVVKEEDQELPTHIKAAAAFDPHWKHGIFAVISKIDSEIPDNELSQFIQVLAKEMTNDQVLDLILNHFLPHIDENPEEDMQQHIDQLRQDVSILQKQSKKESHLDARKDALMKWHDSYILKGPIYLTVWDEVLTDLDVRVMAKLPSNSTWKKGTVGTMNLVFTPMMPLRWYHVNYSSSCYPFSIQGGGFFVLTDPVRLTKKRNSLIKRVACIKQQEWGEENVDTTSGAEYIRVHFSFDLHLEKKGDTDHYFITCDVGPALSKKTDRWHQQLVRSPDVLSWCDQHNLTYVGGHNECIKVEMNTKFYSEFEALQKNVITKEEQLKKYKEAMEHLQRKYDQLVEKVQDDDQIQSVEDIDNTEHHQLQQNDNDSAVSKTVEMEESDKENEDQLKNDS